MGVNNVRTWMGKYNVTGVVNPGLENLWVAGPLEAFVGGSPATPVLLYIHGAAQIGPEGMISPNAPSTTNMLQRLAEHFLVAMADLGSTDGVGSTPDRWGGVDHMARIEFLRLYMNSTYGTSGPIALVGESMGGLGALNYAKAYPANVRSVCAMIPVLDIADFRTRLSAQAAIDPWYAGGYSEPTWAGSNPMLQAASLPPTLPIKLYYSTQDPAIPVTYITNYKAARPQTKSMDCTWHINGSGHVEQTIAIGSSDVVRFCRYPDTNPHGPLNHVTISAPRNGTTSHAVDPSTGTPLAGTNFVPTAGRLLVCVAAADVTSTTPAGWTLPAGGSALGASSMYAFWKTAAGGDTLTTTHGSSNHPAVFDFYEFAAGSTFAAVAAATAVAQGGAGPALSGLTGLNWIGTTQSQSVTSGLSANDTLWGDTAVEQVDQLVVFATTNGWSYSLASIEDNVGAVASLPVTTTLGGTPDRLVFAVSVAA